MFLNKRPYCLILITFFIFTAFSCDNDTDDTIAEPDFKGEIDWVKTFGGSNEEEAIAVVQSNDNGYMVLGFTRSMDGDVTGKTTTDQDYWLLKLNENGEKVWDRTYGGSQDDKASCITKTSDGGYIISGYTASNDGDVTENAGFHDYWIVKINGGGAIQWEKSFGFVGQDQAFKIIETSDGGYFALGYLDVQASEGEGNDFSNSTTNNTRASMHSLGDYWGIKMDANGNKIWRRYFGGNHVDQGRDVLQTPDGGFLLIGVSESSDFDISDARGANDFWIVKVNADGDKIWEKSFGGSESDFAFSVENTLDGNFIIVGDTRSADKDVSISFGNADIWAVKFNNTNGAIIWEKSYGGTDFDSARDISPLENGNFVISGSSRSKDIDVSLNNGSNDAWVFIFDDEGLLNFEKNIGGSNIDFAAQAIETLKNELVVVGYSNSSDFDIPSNKGNNDLLIFKLK